MCRAFWANYSALLLPTMASLLESLPDDTDFKLLFEDQTHWGCDQEAAVLIFALSTAAAGSDASAPGLG